jgi:hypothetical protein
MIPNEISNPENVASVLSSVARKHWARKHESPYPKGPWGGGGRGNAGFNTGPNANLGLVVAAAISFFGWVSFFFNSLTLFFWDEFHFSYAFDRAVI